jgi:hypothetical protein
VSADFAVALHRLQQSLAAFTAHLTMLSLSKYWKPSVLKGSFAGFWVVPKFSRPKFPAGLPHRLDIAQFRFYGACIGRASVGDAARQRVDRFLQNTNTTVPLGDAATHAHTCSASLTVGAPCEVLVQACDAAGDAVATAVGASFRLRLFGDAIVAGVFTDEEGGLYKGVVTPRDAGVYVVEVFAGELTNADHPTKVASSKLFETIFRSTVPLCVTTAGSESASISASASASASVVAASPAAATSDPKLCKSGDEGPGRWRYVRDGVCANGSSKRDDNDGGGGRGHACVGNVDTGLLNDAALSNLDFVWKPNADCVCRIFSPAEMRSCMHRKGIRNVLVTGGRSILREQFYNLCTLAIGRGGMYCSIVHVTPFCDAH